MPHVPTASLLVIAALSGGCAARSELIAAAPQQVATPGPVLVATAPSPQLVADPIIDLITLSNSHFEAGQSELQLGHLDSARNEFNKALDVLLESPWGARSEPRIREHYDRLVERISATELTSLAQGDGFTEKKYEPASIDDLLALSTFQSTPSPETKQAVTEDLESTDHDIAIPLNGRVLSYVELFTGRLRGYLQEGLSRGARFLPMIQSVFRAEGLPLDLAYVPLVESAFKPNALSRTKAKGVWQFMAGTALENGLRRDWYIDERSDPEKATQAAARYLKTLAGLFNGDWHLALASYNGGPGRLQKAMKRTGLDDFWTIAQKPRILPRETREYVPMILAAIIIARNPAQYGFDFEADAPLAYERVMLDRPVDLRRIAEWANTTIDEIQMLNPELRRWTTPLKDDQYELKVPMGSADVVSARLAEAPAEQASLKWYTVKRGETLPVIARKLNVSRNDLADANYLPAAARLTAGQQLMVPHEATVLMAASTDRSVPPAEARRTVPATGTLANASSSNRVKLIYEVKQGDTLSSIAKVFKTSVAAIRTWNPRLNPNHLVTGQRLTVYRSAS